jgi:very-short-patch-repair endonuclease
MTQIAKDLRQRQTPAETILWEALRDRRLNNLKFRRQHPIENTAYVADFLCYEARLLVELDGGVHEGQEEGDAIRQQNIEAQGYHILRFKNEAVFTDLETVLATIAATAQARKAPLPEVLPTSGAFNSPLPEVSPTSGAFNSPLPEVLPTSGAFNSPLPEVLPTSGAFNSPLPEGEGQGVRVITKWDIFYYVYGLLHHPAYRQRYADNLKRELPRIPFAPDFWAFADAGRKLADLHLNYETVEPYELEWVTTPPVSYHVEKMRLNKDKTVLTVNPTLTLQGIPPEAYEYRLGNRSALEWVIDQYQVSEDKRSGIVSDPNGYSDDERYIVNLVERVVRVSVETVEIVRGLAALPFAESAPA